MIYFQLQADQLFYRQPNRLFSSPDLVRLGSASDLRLASSRFPVMVLVLEQGHVVAKSS